MLDAVQAKHDHSHSQNRFAVIPTAKKLEADERFSGRGIRIAFLDSGYLAHPDFASRVIVFHDVSREEFSLSAITEPKGHHWHGTQTVVSCAGDGSLSDSIYRGLAHEAELILVKVSQRGRISDNSIEKGLRWVLENREKYGIRILNMSLGGDADVSTKDSVINQLADELVDRGVAITVAAGNSAESCSIPPASAPSVITVGGYSDENKFGAEEFELYHSSFGATADALVKPELLAPAMYVAAPILPGTEDYSRAELLSMLAKVPDYGFRSMLEEFWQDAGLSADILNHDIVSARKLIEYALHQRKIVATHYQHVDGTSFAAPITASVVAQMLEANPQLTPAAVKNILVSTATRLPNRPAIRQGFGILNAPRAVEAGEAEKHDLDRRSYRPPRIEQSKIVFTFHDDEAASVHLSGNFNDWNRESVPFQRSTDGLWRAAIPHPAVSEIRYKVLVNEREWIEDPSHGFKEEDGFGGFNSILKLD